MGVEGKLLEQSSSFPAWRGEFGKAWSPEQVPRAREGVCWAAAGAVRPRCGRRAGRLSVGAVASRCRRPAASALSVAVLSMSPHMSLGLELQTQQSRPQDASCLPALKVSDIERTVPLTELEVALAGQSGGPMSTGEGATREHFPWSVSLPSYRLALHMSCRWVFPRDDDRLPCAGTSVLPWWWRSQGSAERCFHSRRRLWLMRGLDGEQSLARPTPQFLGGGGRVTRTAEQRGPIRCRRLSWACCARGVQTTRRTPAGPSCFPFPRAPPFTTGGAWGCMTNEIFVSGRGLWKVGLASRLCLSLPQFWFISAVH